MNILFLYHSPILPHLGGLERVTHILANCFKEKGHKVIFLQLGNYPKESQHEENFLSYYLEIDSENSTSKFKDLLSDNKIDIIINQSTLHSTLNFVKNIIPNDVKVFSVLHMQPFPLHGKERLYKSLDYPNTLKSIFLKYLTLNFPKIYGKVMVCHEKKTIKKLLQISDKLVVLSDKFIDRIMAFMPDVDKTKLIAIPNPNTFPSNFYIDLDRKENSILLVGRLFNPQKNITGFLNVWKKFHEANPEWHAIIIGEGPHKKQLEKEAIKSGCKNIEFVGNVKNIDKYYSRAKILALTSLYEGWGMVITEAMSFGCVPVIFNSYDTAEEIINQNETGILVDPFDYEKMVKEMQQLASNKELITKIALSGNKSIKKYEANSIAEKWIHFLSNISK